MKINWYLTKYSRNANIIPEFSNHSSIAVSQDCNLITMSAEKPKVIWGSIGPVEHILARQYIDAIQAAIDIAAFWDNDTGKYLTDVKWDERIEE